MILEVGTRTRAAVYSKPAELEAQLEMLAGSCTDVEIGSQCFEPRECPFVGRCWPDSPSRFGSPALMRARSAGRHCPKGRVGEPAR